jgi:hypothetical protein
MFPVCQCTSYLCNTAVNLGLFMHFFWNFFFQCNILTWCVS